MTGAQRIVATAPGKINLSLRVGAADERGYHALATVFQAVDLLETVTAEPAEQMSLRIDSHVGGHVPADGSNLALRAAELLRRAYGVDKSAALHIDKRVPVAGGMGGGSADAAATLVALNQLWGLGATREELCQLGAELGADVPFAVLGGTALGEGTGTELTPVPCRGSWHWVLAVPGGFLSTPDVYRRFDALAQGVPTRPEPDRDQLEALAAGDVDAAAATIANDLQAAACDLRPDLADALAACTDAGALAAVVSGSGPTLMLLARDADHAAHLAQELPQRGVVQRAYATVGHVPGAQIVGS